MNVDFYSRIIENLKQKLSFQDFKLNRYCVAGRHRSATTKIAGLKTSKYSEYYLAIVHLLMEKHLRTFLVTLYKQKK